MNITQATKATVTATKKAARRTRQPKTAVRLSAIGFALLTFLAQQSTETGSMLSMLIPFEYKAWLTLAGVVATLILGAIGEVMPNRPTEPSEEPKS